MSSPRRRVAEPVNDPPALGRGPRQVPVGVHLRGKVDDLFLGHDALRGQGEHGDVLVIRLPRGDDRVLDLARLVVVDGVARRARIDRGPGQHHGGVVGGAGDGRLRESRFAASTSSGGDPRPAAGLEARAVHEAEFQPEPVRLLGRVVEQFPPGVAGVGDDLGQRAVGDGTAPGVGNVREAAHRRAAEPGVLERLQVAGDTFAGDVAGPSKTSKPAAAPWRVGGRRRRRCRPRAAGAARPVKSRNAPSRARRECFRNVRCMGASFGVGGSVCWTGSGS